MIPIPLVSVFILVVGWITINSVGSGNAALIRVLRISLAAKMVAVGARYVMVTGIYGFGDSDDYYAWGEYLAIPFRRLDFGAYPGNQIPGTGTVRMFTGIVFALFGIDKFAGFLMFGFLAWLGTVAVVRAFAVTMPGADVVMAAKLVCLWPTLLFWPSSIGKDALLVALIGLTVLGMAWIFVSYSRGYLCLVGGLAGLTMVRPHIAVLMLSAFISAFVFSAVFRSGHTGRANVVGKFLVGAVLVTAVALVAPVVADFFQVDVSVDGLSDTLDETTRRTSQGGSEFAAPNANTPHGYALAVVTVLVRPFPWEAHNIGSILTALEGVALSVLLWRRRRSVLAGLRASARTPLAMTAVVYVLAFAYVFAAIANFGILARQRTQVLPFVLLLTAMPVGPAAAMPSAREDAAEPARRPTGRLAPPRSV